MKKTIFIKNAAILTASSLILRFIGIVFKVWLAGSIGSEGIGLYQLVFSVYVLVTTFATSGICTAVTRLCADELALGSKKGTLKILLRCTEITLLLALISFVLVFFGADFIGERIIEDQRSIPAIKILSFSLPFISVSSCVKGYFIARRKASPTATSQLLEQLVRIGIIVFALGNAKNKGIAYSCLAVMLGDTVAEFASAVYLGLLLLIDTKKLNTLSGRSRPPYKITKEITRISFPITLGRYLNTALRTGENILVPKFLSKYPFGADNALSQFGMIKGMALPLLFFPSTLLNSLSTLLIPEMSEASALGKKYAVKDSAEKIISITTLLSLIVSAVFFVSGRQIGLLVYKSEDVGSLLCALSPIVPLMYLDSISDGILKGLDQQNYTFKHSILDSLVRIILVVTLLQHFGMKGFIGIMYFSNLFTCGLNVRRLIITSGAKINLTKTLLIPLVFALIIAFSSDILISAFNLSLWLYVSLLSILCVIVYILVLIFSGCLDLDIIKNYLK